MFDILILTAGNIDQRRDFEIQLKSLNLNEFCKEVRVIHDEPVGCRIGSGGAMISIAHKLKLEFGCGLATKMILLIHSGGLSQRMPHLSAFGKIFAHLPGGKTMLEIKLETYRNLPDLLGKGVLVAASDVIEDTSKFQKKIENADFVCFATESNSAVAQQHGVFVLNDNNQLISVLQKPTEIEMIEANAIHNGRALTDCFYWMSFDLFEKLGNFHDLPIKDELCCYGDFMRPLGARPLLGYLKTGTPSLQEWRLRFADVFKGVRTEVARLGPDSFFHFGTIPEFLFHCSSSSVFRQKFLTQSSGIVSSELDHCEVDETSFLQFCSLRNAKVGRNCILSDVHCNVSVEIPHETLVFTVAISPSSFVTVAFRTNEDPKKTQKEFIWFGHKTNLEDISLWEAPIFMPMPDREESLKATLEQLRGSSLDVPLKGMSIKEIVEKKNVATMIMLRSASTLKQGQIT